MTNEKTIKEYDATLCALEVINKNLMDVINSKEYTEGKKILRWISLMRQHRILRNIPNYIKHRAVKEELLDEAFENFTNDEWKSFLHYGDTNLKIAVYTCITGGYDYPKTPLLQRDNMNFYLYTDEEKQVGRVTNGWKCLEIPKKLNALSNTEINRYIKMHPFEFFENDYDYSIYLDGNVQAVSDISVFTEMVNEEVGIAAHRHRFRDCVYDEEKMCELKGKGDVMAMREQIINYRKESYPKHYGLIECTVLVTQLNNSTAKNIYDQWWEEFNRYDSRRDQISLPYILWRNDIAVSSIVTLGRNLYKNPKIRVYDH